MTSEDRERHALHRRMIERGVVAAKQTHPSTAAWAALVRSFNAAMDARDAADRERDRADAHRLGCSA